MHAVLITNPFESLLDSGSEFIDNLLQKIQMNMYQGLYDATDKQFSTITDTMNNGIIKASTVVTTKPQSWNATAFSFIKGVAENAFIPVAACILTFVFCWEIIHLVQENNQMHNIKPETVLLILLKLGICLLACSKSFVIVNGFFDVAADVSAKVGGSTAGANNVLASLADLGIERELTIYTFSDIFEMLGNLLLTTISKWIVYAICIAILLRVNLWYLELLVYASAAPVPFSTFMNKEWGQMGMNYIRKMLAVAFEGVFMLVVFGLYTALSQNILTASGADEYLMSMVKTCGCGIALFFMLGKVGNISSSIFNAH